MPFNSSTAILYYNKSLFRRPGLKTDKAPASFEEIEKAAKAVVGLGSQQDRVHRGLALVDPHGEHARVARSSPLQTSKRICGPGDPAKNQRRLSERLMDLLSRWQNEGNFYLLRPGSKGDQPVTNGEAAIALASTGLVGTLMKTAKIRMGTGFLPSCPDFPRGTALSAAPASLS